MRASACIAALAILAVVALANCTPGERVAVSAKELAALRTEAQAFANAGDHGAARQVYLSMARRAANADRNRYRILAAREAGRDGSHRRALDELRRIEPAPPWLGLWSLATAESEQVLDGPQAAYNRLSNVDPGDFPNLAAELIGTRSELLFAMQRPSDALDELTRLDAGVAPEGDARLSLVWSLLREFRAELSPVGVTGPALGWVELALLAERLAEDPVDAGAELKAWREKFPGHPASALLAGTIIPEVCGNSRAPARLALLLPGSQSYATARRSLREGFLAARFALMTSCPSPDIAFYDVVDSADAAAQWSLAAAEGAQFIVGPLLPASVRNTAEVAGGVPSLALNTLRGRPPPEAFEEFALAPEHEARQVARQALRRGLRRALVLYPRTRWGQRIYRSFLDEYQAGGGRLAGREQYSLTAVDYSDQIGRLLKVSASNRRASELRAKLGRNLGFQPRRRQDADLIFVIARAPQGQLLIPQLRYNYSGDLPIFAIQSIYDRNHPDNRDLNGVEMPALPVLAEQHVQVAHGQLSAETLSLMDFNLSLFAMGYDSFKLALSLYDGSEALASGIRGLTGTIYRASGGSLDRELTWTQIVDGSPAAVPAMP
ncbi:penicillin-binding protein activator [Candidatus Foliamicus sp.]